MLQADRQVDDNHPGGTTISAPQNPRLSHLWKLSPITIEPSDHEFDRLRDRGLLQFWSSTATVELCHNDPDNWGGHFIFPKYLHQKKYDSRLIRCLDKGQPHLTPEDSRTATTPNTKCAKHKQSTVVAIRLR